MTNTLAGLLALGAILAGLAAEPAWAAMDAMNEMRTVERRAAIHAQPHASAADRGTLPKGATVQLIGRDVDSGWFLLRRDGRILGYVAPDAFGEAPAAARREADTVRPTATRETDAAPVESNRAPIIRTAAARPEGDATAKGDREAPQAATFPDRIYDFIDGGPVSGWRGKAHGVTFGDGVAKLSQMRESRIAYSYARGFPREGFMEMLVRVDEGYRYSHGSLMTQQSCALIFTTDVQGGDVTWLGSAWLYACANGDITFHLAGAKFKEGWEDRFRLKAQGTPFRFGEWARVGIAFGEEGQYILLNGVVVAANPDNRQKLDGGGNERGPQDQPTIGESVSSLWGNNQHEGGFDGAVAKVWVASTQDPVVELCRTQGLCRRDGGALVASPDGLGPAARAPRLVQAGPAGPSVSAGQVHGGADASRAPCKAFGPHEVAPYSERIPQGITPRWSGRCFDGYAQGPGVLVYRIGPRDHIFVRAFFMDGQYVTGPDINRLVGFMSDSLSSGTPWKKIDYLTPDEKTVRFFERYIKSDYLTTDREECRLAAAGWFELSEPDAAIDAVNSSINKVNQHVGDRWLEVGDPTRTMSGSLSRNGTRHWTGKCANGLAEGPGTLRINNQGRTFDVVIEKMVAGSPQGRISLRVSSSTTFENWFYKGIWVDSYAKYSALVDAFTAVSTPGASGGLLASEARKLIDSGLNITVASAKEADVAEAALADLFDIRFSLAADEESPRTWSESFLGLSLDSVQGKTKFFLHWDLKPKDRATLARFKAIRVDLDVGLITKEEMGVWGVGMSETNLRRTSLEIPLTQDNGFSSAGSALAFDLQTYVATSTKGGYRRIIKDVEPRVTVGAIRSSPR